jgi:hypothetical protein
MFNILNQYEDLIELSIPIDQTKFNELTYNWIPYNPRKNINRWGCSITSLDGNDSGLIDLDSLLEYNKINNTKHIEKDFNQKTKHSFPFDYFLKNFEVGRSHFLKLGVGGHFPWHRDPDDFTFRIIYTIENCEWTNLVWLEEDRVLPLKNNKWYYINTKKRHAVMAFDECIFAVFNTLNTFSNLKKLKEHFFIK